MREVEEALARWRNAERRFTATEPGSLDHIVAPLECEAAQSAYERLVEPRWTEIMHDELTTGEATP